MHLQSLDQLWTSPASGEGKDHVATAASEFHEERPWSQEHREHRNQQHLWDAVPGGGAKAYGPEFDQQWWRPQQTLEAA